MTVTFPTLVCVKELPKLFPRLFRTRGTSLSSSKRQDKPLLVTRPPRFSSQEGTPGAFCHLSLRSTIEEVLDLFFARFVAKFILLPASHHHRHLRDTGRLWRGRTWGPSVTRQPLSYSSPTHSHPLHPPGFRSGASSVPTAHRPSPGAVLRHD